MIEETLEHCECWVLPPLQMLCIVDVSTEGSVMFYLEEVLRDVEAEFTLSVIGWDIVYRDRSTVWNRVQWNGLKAVLTPISSVHDPKRKPFTSSLIAPALELEKVDFVSRVM
jgi:hypothetical protein